MSRDKEPRANVHCLVLYLFSHSHYSRPGAMLRRIAFCVLCIHRGSRISLHFVLAQDSSNDARPIWFLFTSTSTCARAITDRYHACQRLEQGCRRNVDAASPACTSGLHGVWRSVGVEVCGCACSMHVVHLTQDDVECRVWCRNGVRGGWIAAPLNLLPGSTPDPRRSVPAGGMKSCSGTCKVRAGAIVRVAAQSLPSMLTSIGGEWRVGYRISPFALGSAEWKGAWEELLLHYCHDSYASSLALYCNPSGVRWSRDAEGVKRRM